MRLRERGVVAGFEFTFGSSDTLLLGRRRRIRRWRRRRSSTRGPGPEVKNEERKKLLQFFFFTYSLLDMKGEKEKKEGNTGLVCVVVVCVCE